MSSDLIDLARQIADMYHQGQYRKECAGVRLPYIVHPKSVAQFVSDYGFTDDKTIAVAWLHDVLEDTTMTYDGLQNIFGDDVAQGVYLLTRNVDNDEYKSRLLDAPIGVQIVKLCDTLDNIITLECLSAQGIEKKVTDCQQFYIPLAKELCPALADMLVYYIDLYLEKYEV